jgi:hypothetical protein
VSAADSLILADVVELLGGGVISAHPLCPGAQITLVGFDFGSPQPQTEIVASLLLDGERPSGRRASNRTISLPIQIRGPSRPIMDGARELLQQLVDQDTWRLTWTPDPGTGTALPLVFDCFRATATVTRDLVLEDNLVSQLTLTFPALPYGRSDTLTTLAFPTPASFPQPANPIRLDDYSTVSSSTQPTWWSQSTQHVSDSFSAHWSWAITDQDSGPFYTRTLAAPVDITGLGKLTFQFGLGTSNFARWHKGNVTFAITLTDNAAHTLSFGGNAYCTASNQPTVPTWTQVTFAIPTSATFDYTHLNSYSIRAWRFIDTDGDLELDSDSYLNGLTATASALNPFAAVRGTLYQIGAPGGTARAPMSAQFQSPPVTVPTTTNFTTPGITSWTAPAGVTSAKIRVKAAGGKGGDRSTTGQGGGAGGGADAGEDTYPVVPGQTYPITIGAAGGSGGFPTLVASYFDHEDAWNYNTLVTQSFTPTAGELIVVKALNSERSQTFGTPSGGGLSFTNRVDQNVTSHCRADIWTATVGASPTAMTISLTVAASQQNHAFVVERWSGAKLAGSPAVINATGSGAPSAVETTVANNSVISWVNGDFDQGTGARTYRGTPTEEQYWTAGDCTGYFAWQTQATAGAVTVGLTAPSQTWTMAAIEIQAFNTGALTDGGASSFDLLTAVGGASVPVNTTTGGLGGADIACTLRSFLTGATTSFEGSIGTWVAQGNSSVTLTAAQAHSGTGSLQVTSLASGDMNAASVVAANILTAGMPVVAGQSVMCSAWFRSAVSVRTCRVGAIFFDSAGVTLSTVFSANTAADSTSAWTPVAGPVTAPASSAFCRLVVQVQATGAGSEVHYVDDAQLAPGSAYSGGNGAAASTTGGGGGSSAGDDAAGANGSGVTGGTAPSGGGNGGNGGAAGANNGTAGSAPGGAGGGSSSTGAAQTGGNGANGKVAITFTPPLNPFHTLVAHAPSYTAPATLNPLIPVGGGLDTPNGGTEYTITSPVPGLPARYYGTYTIIAVASVVNTPSASRTWTIGFKQYDYTSGPSTTRTVARTFTPTTESPVITNGFVVVGEITLPCRDIAPDNSTAFTNVTVTSTNTSDRLLDILVLDVRGQLAAINISGTGHVNYFLDEPDIDRDWGRILASDYDRPQATSVLDANDMILSGGPLLIDPNGPGWLLAYSPDAGAPGLTATFFARWRDSRLS